MATDIPRTVPQVRAETLDRIDAAVRHLHAMRVFAATVTDESSPAVAHQAARVGRIAAALSDEAVALVLELVQLTGAGR